jgi:hypothetical protein
VTPAPYGAQRTSQLRVLLRLALGAAAVLLGWAGVVLGGGGAAATALGVLVLPGLLLGGLAGLALVALARGHRSARLLGATTGVVALLVALLLSRTLVGLLVAVVGVPLLLVAVLPGRDPDT